MLFKLYSYSMKKVFMLTFLFLVATLGFAQERNVKGTVTSTEDGSPIPGVSISVKGTTTGTISDINGNYAVSVPDNATLVFSFIGLKRQEIPVAGKSTINVQMENESLDVDEVVVVGYGTQKKSVVTGAIASVKAEDLEKATPTRIEDVLKGRLSGVSITQSSGQPGSDSRVLIRGTGTINDNSPLYIIDGMPVGGGIDYLNPSDIKSVEVLKDAASAAVYGARASNGVILVTTKSGSKGKMSISYNFSYGWQNPWKLRRVLNAEQYKMMINETLLNSGKAPIYDTSAKSPVDTDWQDELFNYNAPTENHQVSINGGSEKGTYFLGLGYYSQDGIIGGNYGRSNYDRWNLRFNNTYTVFDETDSRQFVNKFRVGTNIGYSRITSTGVTTNSEYGSPLGSAMMISPLIPVYAENPDAVLADHPTAVADENGRVFSIPGKDYNEITNPIAAMYLPPSKGNSDKFVSTFWGELTLYKNLKFKSSFGTDLAFWGNDSWAPEFYLGPTNYKDVSEVYSEMHRGYTWQVENTLSYDFKINDKHNFTVLLGQSANRYQARYVKGKNYDLNSYDPIKVNIDFAKGEKAVQEAGGTYTDGQRLISYFGRINYNYNEKYMLEATVRRDGSSKFGPDNRFGNFYAFSGGWTITQEEFMAGRPEWFDFMKLRVSWGTNGNDRIGDFRYTTIINGGNNYPLGVGDLSTIEYGAKPNGIPNPNIKWEESEQTDIGLDTRFWGGAVSLTLDYWVKKTNGMLMEMQIPSYNGDSKPVANVGDMKNSGVDIDLSYRFRVSDATINLSANASYLKNELIYLGNETGWANYDNIQNVGTISRGENGYPFPYFYGKKTAGIFQTQDQVDAYVNADGGKIQPNATPGDVIFVDLDGDGQITDDDRTMIGKGMPDWTFSFIVDANWKGFDFNAFFQGVTGNDIFDATRRIDLPYTNMPAYYLDRWTGPGTSNSFPKVDINNPNKNWESSDLYIQNGQYLRLKKLELGYTLPRRLTAKALVQKLRVYVAAENLWTLTGYRGYDPEMSADGTSIGIDKGVYPQARTLMVGANISF
ncbi:SusC/RagA family TonB-linked outer membrane protein [Prolixibacter bellariivorans]|uniref:SusC/RagA family TonB-linked outer membrane protein n=3 Tax=Prolixibacter bellariivorans TaxID=314319 RepID=A0A5M4AZQ4_9BACT|nr:SusC/RagA family TonB-linked outer membrane protein [Prolixibacter bellariivorans]